MTSPAVSVIMTVFNGHKYLREAIDSILAQTWTDFEYIIVDDGSTDSSASIVASYGDERIRFLRLPHAGLVQSLNSALENCRGRYVARMDADDRSTPQRLSLQFAYLESHPNIDVLCTDVVIIDSEGRRTASQRQSGLDNDLLRDGLLFRRPIKPVIHPSVMLRRQAYEELGGYREFHSAEDRDLWLRAIDKFNFARLEEICLEYRVHEGGISREKSSRHATSSAMSAVNYLVHQQTGKDLFSEDRASFDRASALLQTRLETEVLPISLKFRQARTKTLSGERVKGWLELMGLIVSKGPDALPRGTLNRTRQIVEQVASQAALSLGAD